MIAEVWPILNAKLRGHYQYYGINDNWPQLIKYQRLVERLSFRWMRRRSHKGQTHSWSNFRDFVKQHPLALPHRLTDLIALHR